MFLVDFSDNYLGPMGASVLAQAIKQNSSIQEVYMKGNDIGNEGVKSICEALLVSSLLDSLLQAFHERFCTTAIR